MDLRTFFRDGGNDRVENVVRVEVPIVDGHGEHYKLILLDADDSFDVVLEYPEGTRETLREITQFGEQLGN